MVRNDKKKMIKGLRKLANWLQDKKCKLHFWWNARLDSLKVECNCQSRK